MTTNAGGDGSGSGVNTAIVGVGISTITHHAVSVTRALDSSFVFLGVRTQFFLQAVLTSVTPTEG